MTKDEAAKLRAAFPAEMIGKLPKPTKADNPKGTCSVCGGWHGLPAVHLDYVGHAATTDRLLSVDPEWTWEPMAIGPNGEPLMTNGGMWIKLTVCGVTRPGFGDGKTAKEVIGDAIRNAAMRFGVALDLWAKEDLHGDEAAKQKPDPAGDLPDALQPLQPPANGEESSRPGFIDPSTQLRTEAQAKMLFALLPKAVKGGFLTDEVFIAACIDQGATGDTVSAVINSLGKVAATKLISRLKDLEAQSVAA